MCTFHSNSYAQNDSVISKPSIQVVARAYSDSVLLRFAPTTPVAWQKTNAKGYSIIRYTIVRDGKLLKTPEKLPLTTIPLKPLPIAQWESPAKRNKYAAIAAQALYGKNFSLTNPSSGLAQMITAVKENENRFSFALFAADQSLEVARLSGLFYADKNVKKNEKYLYQVFIEPDKAYRIDTGFAFIAATEVKKLTTPKGLDGEFGDRSIALSWSTQYDKDLYNSYIVERSDDNGKTFIIANELPFVSTTIKENKLSDIIFKLDSLPQNNKKYIFRIKGKTIFDELGPPSDTVQGMGKAMSNGIASAIIKTELLPNNQIKIYWRNTAKNIASFLVLRSNTAEGNYTLINKANALQTMFIDTKPQSTNYYVISAVDESGKPTLSHPYLVQLKDSTPPNAPINLKASIDISGSLRLSWTPPKELDLEGYRVYMANSANEEYTQISKTVVRDTVFKDTILVKTLTEKVYFKIMALDHHFNQSVFSEVLSFTRPDVVPPASPVLQNYKTTDSTIYLEWKTSSSTDVVSQKIYRKTASEEWKLIAKYDNNISSNFLDKAGLSMGNAYQYKIVAVDEANLESENPIIISLQLIDYGFRPSLQKIVAKADRLKKEVNIGWEYETIIPTKVSIYRAIKGKPLRLYDAVNGNEKTYADKQLTINTNYIYKIRAEYPDGGMSVFSQALEVNY